MDATPAETPTTAGAWSAFRSRDFSLFWTAALVSNTGNWMQTITVPFVIDQMTHSTVWVGVAAFCAFFPSTVVGPLAGSLADRYSRRSVLMWAQGILAISAFALWGTYVGGVATPEIILVCVIIGAVGAGITIASWQAFVTQLVPKESMLSAVRLNGMQFTGARAFGPALAGLVLATLGPSTAFFFNAITYLLVIGVLAVIAARPIASTSEPGTVLDHFREAWRYMRARTVLVLGVMGAGVSALLGISIVQLAEPFARNVLHEGPGAYGLMVGAYGVGAIIGSFVMVATGDRWKRSAFTVVGFSLFVVGEVVLGLAPAYAFALVGLAAIGLAQVLAMVSCQTAIQVNVDEHFRGRVLSIYVMCFFAGTPIGALIGGIVADFVGLRATVVGAGVLMACTIVYLVLRYDRLRPLDEALASFEGYDSDPVTITD
ncbi:MAG: MFS transporter [Acidimicrobiia bacterium]